MEIHCFQYDTAWENPKESFRRIDSLVAETSFNQGDLLIFPELSAVGFSMDVDAIAEPTTGVSFQYFSDLASRLNCYVIAGISGRDAESNRGLNDAVCFNTDGTELSRYRKVHPFPLLNEGDHYLAGEEAVVFGINGWKIAPTICYDLRFPELYRAATLGLGAEILINIANWPTPRVEHWITLLRARAIENLAYVIGVNRCGKDPHLSYPGASMIVNPQGEIVVQAGDAPEVIRAVLNRPLFDDWRSTFPALRDAKQNLFSE